MKITAVIFDLDGTLTRPILDFKQIRSEIGLDSGDILTAIKAMDPAGRKRANAILERHERYAVENATLNDGVPELLEALRKRTIAIGLLTRNTRENTLYVARRHRLTFDAVVDRHDGPAKPDGAGVLKLCEQFASSPAETLVVGDFLHDLHSARNAGAIAVLMETHPDAEQFKPYADYSISQMSELMDLIDQLEHPSTRISL
jgi:HAD superfamily hydrolase (TIGR01509 family)